MPSIITVKIQETMDGVTKAFVLLIPLMVAFTAAKQYVGYFPNKSIFNDIKKEASPRCGGKTFYNVNDFKDAVSNMIIFGHDGPHDMRVREFVSFLANVAIDTDSMCHVRELTNATYCTPNKKYPCVPGQKYFGRGPLMLRGNAHYGAAGEYFHLDLLTNPDLVATDAKLSWQIAIWFWTKYSNCHEAITTREGFGATIRALHSEVCDGRNPSAVTRRVNYYKKLCSKLAAHPGYNLRC